MNWFIVLEVIYYLFLIAVALKILNDTQSSTKAAAYILLLFILPVAGIIIYLSFGLNYRKSGIYSKKIEMDEAQSKHVDSLISDYISTNTPKFKKEHFEYMGLSNMVYEDNQSFTTRNNKVEILQNGENKFRELLEALRNAKHHIHIEYYIYEDDEIGNELANILMEKAREGVEVRFIYDDFGSRSIRKTIVPKLRESGVEAYAFYEITFIYLANRLNYRNHRKIVIIDGDTSFVGGVNVSDKYINKSAQDLYWRDTHIKIDGEATWLLQQIFFADWNFCANQQLKPSREYFRNQPRLDQGNWVQIVSSGPDSKMPSILYSYLQAIGLAKNEICITTPYLIPGEEFLHALYMAVLRGVKVKILLPEVSDSWFVNTVCRSYFGDLLENGVEIYLYQKGFIHAKTMVCDDKLAVVGTANLDHRSFDLNFEVNAIMYDDDLAKELKTSYYQDLENARKLELEEWNERKKVVQLLEKSLRIVAPLM
ncbi:cardiolipin synthase [Weeksellaceae bacterium KMM 9713]|uniref:Cardiolipin synthase n=1 Tax=Profundicola chukchiensis TaxID=2961959 RepID=A0A9X4MV41_9FLAO|nr:cardiolipin synthase [Profundicola chukchiensis]MDG4945456.1 cardiolipin synthase [Profundicola chukchiensis]